MKLLKSISYVLSCLSIVSAYKADRVTNYGGEGDETSAEDPFCQDYGVDGELRGIDNYAALSALILYKDTAKTYCNKIIKLTNAKNGKTTRALVVDKCRSCGYGNVDLSVDAFLDITHDGLDIGVLKDVTWCIEGLDNKYGCSSSDSSTKKTTKKTTTTKKRTTTTTRKTTRKTTTTTRKTTTVNSASTSYSAGGIYVQLEKGERRGYTSIASSIDGYSGSGYIRITKSSSDSSRSYVRTYVNMKKEGKYTIILKYNNSNSSCVTNRLIINNNIYKIKFSKTGSNWKKLEIKNVPFKKGSNKVEVRATDGYMSFDYVYIE